MKIRALILTMVLILVSALPAAASGPVGQCPPNFELHHMMHHDNAAHMHTHIGVDRDLNGDGYLCVKHINAVLHLHIDNRIPLK